MRIMMMPDANSLSIFNRILLKMCFFLLSPPLLQPNQQHTEFSFLLKERVCPLLIKLFSPSLKHRQGMSAPSAPVNPPEKPTFHMSLRLLRVVSVVINKYYSLLVSSWFSTVNSLVLLIIIDLICFFASFPPRFGKLNVHVCVLFPCSIKMPKASSIVSVLYFWGVVLSGKKNLLW